MFKILDNLSPKITLFYKGFHRHSSSISGIITILTYITIIILSLIFSFDFLLKRNPTSYFYNRFTYDVGTFSFNNTGIFHFIQAGERNDIPYDNRIVNVIGINEYSTVISENTNITLYDHWIYEPCNNQHIGDLKKYLNDYETSFYNGICINKFYNKTTKEIINLNDKNFKYPIIEHGNSNPNSNPYGIFILRCQNHSELNKTDCYEKDISDKKILEVDIISLYFIDHYIDVTNYHNPLEGFYNKIRNQIVLSSYTINHLNFKPLKLNTHTGIIVNSNSALNSFNYDVNEKLITEESNTGIYSSFYFWMENETGIFDRKYQKVQDISASISGISELLTIIGYCINYLFAKITLINDLSNDILKKGDKFGKNTCTKGFKILKKSNIISINKFPFQNSEAQKIDSKNGSEYNSITPLYNKIMDYNTPKNKLNKVSSPFGNIINNKKITIKQILYYHLCCFKKNNVYHLIITRKKVLSEEKLFTTYFILGTLSNIFLNNYQNNNTGNKTEIKKNKIFIPKLNVYDLGKNINKI